MKRFGRVKPDLTIFFATDLHGSSVCFRKFLAAPGVYGADVAVLGGDMTGKLVIPIVRQPRGSYRARVAGQEVQVGAEELPALRERIAAGGHYPYLTDPDEMAALQQDSRRVDDLFRQLMTATLRAWGELADKKFAGTEHVIYVAPGNDDPFFIDEVIAELPRFRNVEGEIIRLGEQYEVLSTGWTNPTPWMTHREYSEEEIAGRLDEMAGRLGKRDAVPAAITSSTYGRSNEASEEEIAERIATLAGKLGSFESVIFNIHPPPFNTGLDVGPDLDPETWQQRSALGQGFTKPVGSHAVRGAIEKYQPMLGLHGHIHESRGTTRIGRTLCINPGSDYGDGILRGCLVYLSRGQIRSFQLTSG